MNNEEKILELLGIMNKRFDTLEKDITDIKIELNKVKIDLNTVKSDLNTVKSDLNHVKADLSEVKADVKEIKKRVISLEETASDTALVNEYLSNRIDKNVIAIKTLANKAKIDMKQFF